MMKTIFVVCFCALFGTISAGLHCHTPNTDFAKEWQDMENACIQKMRHQIQKEFNASMHYLAMGSYFGRDSVNLPGFAKTFYEAASEERQHGIKLIEYLSMRGGLTSDISTLVSHTVPDVIEWSRGGEEALRYALKLESEVTKSIRSVIQACESPSTHDNTQGLNDYHLVDYLTGVYLEEQYKGEREIAGRISTLGKLMKAHGKLGQFIFDKKLLKGDV